MAIRKITLRRLSMPLVQPYRLSYRTFEVFEPFFVEVEDSDGRTGMADALISPGSSKETPEAGWAYCIEQINAVLGLAGRRRQSADPQALRNQQGRHDRSGLRARSARTLSAARYSGRRPGSRCSPP